MCNLFFLRVGCTLCLFFFYAMIIQTNPLHQKKKKVGREKIEGPPMQQKVRSSPISIPTKNKSGTTSHRRTIIKRNIPSSLGESPPVRTWELDYAVNKCTKCETSFGWLVRKHHCRMCGRIYCHNCSSYECRIPERYWSTMPESPPSIVGKMLDWNKHKGKPKRVCNQCRKTVEAHSKSDRLIKVLGLVMRCWYQIDDNCMRVLAKVNEQWRDVADYYTKQFHRLVRSPMVGDAMQTDDPNVQRLLAGNAQLIFHEYPHLVEKVCVQISQESQRYRCDFKFDERTVMDVASAYHLLDAPKTDATSERLNSQAQALLERSRVLAVAELKKKTQKMEFFISRLVFMSDLSVVRSVLNGLDRVSLDRMYWVSRVYKPAVADMILASRPDIREDVQRSVEFVKLIQKLVARNIKGSQRKKLVKTWRAANKSKSVYLPGMYPTKVRTILITDIHTKASSSTPVAVPCVCYKGPTSKPTSTEVVNMLYKPEPVLNDVVMMDCLGLLHNLLQNTKREDWYVSVVWYSVIPVSKDSGLIAMVPRSRTLQGIAHKEKMTLLNFILDKNRNSSVDDLIKSFVRSCAVCSIQSMVFGLGDRHLENILLTEDGCMFHVDYTYLFGKEPQMKTLVSKGRNQMKLTPSIVDVMGGQESRYFKMFRDQSQIIYNVVRLHSSELFCLCEPIVKTGYISRKKLLQYFYKTLRPGEHIRNANIQIENIINFNTKNRTIDTILDKLHSTYTMFF